jgi:ferrous iron transport protein B
LRLSRIALIGNPNSGKTTLFNQLTGLNQKIGNFPGVTVDKHSGHCRLSGHQLVEIIDLPGTYSLYPKSLEEHIVIQTLLDPSQKPDLVAVVVDASNLKRNLLLYTQVYDLGIPTLLIINMIDVAKQKGFELDIQLLAHELQTEILSINARTGENLLQLKKAFAQKLESPSSEANKFNPFVDVGEFAAELTDKLPSPTKVENRYEILQKILQTNSLQFLSEEEKQGIDNIRNQHIIAPIAIQTRETLLRYDKIESILKKTLSKPASHFNQLSLSEKIDKILIHRFWGLLIFLGLMLLVFQSIFAWAQVPMDLIDRSFGWLQQQSKAHLPSGVLTDLLADGILAGLGGILVFIPQIAILFIFISLLEESGYMARAVFMMDKLMRKVGLNGRSVVPLISGIACAVPAIMATRTIENWKERLITVLVTPLMSCSARLPVYTILIAMVVPKQYILGIFNLQGIAFLGMYLLGFVMAMLSALVLHKILKNNREKSLLIMELPAYQVPSFKNVVLVVWEKVRVFVIEAGKVIMAISIILWVLASYGPGDAMQAAENKVKKEYAALAPKELDNKIASARLENSYAGYFGKFIEPAIAPLGYDWKIGIALLTSFAAREVFVGTLSTIYSLGSDNEKLDTLQKRLQAEINPKTQKPFYTPAVAFSLLVFYAFAMQCMSTVATVYRETKGWKYPLIQFIYLTSLAYLGSWLTFNLLS